MQRFLCSAGSEAGQCERQLRLFRAGSSELCLAFPGAGLIHSDLPGGMEMVVFVFLVFFLVFVFLFFC